MNRYKRSRIVSEPLKLPEKVRVRLAELYRIAQQAQREFGLSAGLAFEFLGLDPSGRHDVNFETGVVTPQAADEPKGPTLVKEEATG